MVFVRDSGVFAWLFAVISTYGGGGESLLYHSYTNHTYLYTLSQEDYGLPPLKLCHCVASDFTCILMGQTCGYDN